MGSKADQLRAMREAQFDAGARRRKLSEERERLKKAMDEAAARVAAKPKRRTSSRVLRASGTHPKPFIDDTMLVPTGSLTKKTKRKKAKHK